MPRYTYRCTECEEQFEQVHSITERMTDCFKCELGNCLVRVPSEFITIKKKKEGTIVKRFIEDAKESLEIDKQQLGENR